MLDYLKIKNITVVFFILSNLYIALPASSKSKIKILMPAPFADATKELVKEFNTKNKQKVYAEVIRGPLETEAVSDLAISSLILDKSDLDVILIDVTWLAKYVEAGWLRRLDYLFKGSDINKLAKGARRGNYYAGKLYRWPLVADMGILYWRKDLMKYPPRTYSELVKISKDLQQENKVKYGYLWQGKQYEGLSCVFLEVLKGYGGKWIDQEGNSKLDSSESIKAAKWLKELISKRISPIGVTNYGESEVLQLFSSGEAAFMRNWPYAWSELNKDNSEVKGKVGIASMVSEDGSKPSATLGSWGFSILKGSDKHKEAAALIKYLTSLNAQKRLLLNNNYTPTNKSLYLDLELQKKIPILPQLYKALNHTDERPQNPLYAQTSDILQRALSRILTTDTSPTKGMREANKKTIKMLKANVKL